MVLLVIAIPSAFAEFNLQTDGVFYKITGMTETKTYYHTLTDGNMTLIQGERKITPANNEAIMPLPYQNSPGIYVWNWYADSKKTILVDTISWNLYDSSLEKVEISEVTINVSTEFAQYLEGESIVIFGTITPREWGIPVIIQVVNEDNQLVRVSQIIPNQDGNYETSLVAQGVTLIKHQKIMVRATYLGEISTTDFEFIPRETIPTIIPNKISQFQPPEPTTLLNKNQIIKLNGYKAEFEEFIIFLENKINDKHNQLERALIQNNTKAIKRLNENIDSLTVLAQIYKGMNGFIEVQVDRYSK